MTLSLLLILKQCQGWRRIARARRTALTRLGLGLVLL
jgi:hypothetical protein